jgi:aryl-alcohol dehydrogenase-like predicted oxidoreductase
MGCGRIDSLVIHDLEPNNFNSSWEESIARLEDELCAPNGGFRELQKMRKEGVISHFGAGTNDVEQGECPETK